MYFPPDVWFIIKTMEYQMLYPPNIQKQYISNIKSFVRLPYLLKQHQNKNTTHQVLFLRHNYPLFWNVFQEQDDREGLGKSSGQSIDACFDECEHMLINDGSIESLYEKIDHIMSTITGGVSA